MTNTTIKDKLSQPLRRAKTPQEAQETFAALFSKTKKLFSIS
jgi:hypothetical protein